MKCTKMPEIGSGTGFLLGQQQADYFNFVCGDCGLHPLDVTVEDVDAVGFRFSAKCQGCGKTWKGLKISADWGKPMEPHIEPRFHEISARMTGS